MRTSTSINRKPFGYRELLFLLLLLASGTTCFGWGFFGHRKINRHAVFGLPPGMLLFYKKHLHYLGEHAIDPDKRRYAVAEEAARHYIDLDHYGAYPYDSLPRGWKEAAARYSEDSLNAYGIVPWWIGRMHYRLTEAFRAKDKGKILKLSAEIGHYLADAHVPLHATGNYDGQRTGQKGIHGFWESRIPELLAERDWHFFTPRAVYLPDPETFIWSRVLESAAAADTVLRAERELTALFPSDKKFSFEARNGVVVRQYSAPFCTAYDKALNGMIGRRMRSSIHAVASFWYTAWADAGQPDLGSLEGEEESEEDKKESEELDRAWRAGFIRGREH